MRPPPQSGSIPRDANTASRGGPGAELSPASWTRNPALLRGVRVLEVADEQASFCGKLLADFGADVLKIEPPGGDPARHPWQAEHLSSHNFSFLYHNCGKRSITLNIAHPAAREPLLKIIAGSDVLVEDLLPGTLEAIGVERKLLRELNPRLIHCSITGFGQTGPRRSWRSCDLVSAAAGGQVHVTGSANRAPLKLFGPQALYLGCLYAVLGIVIALIQRNATGRGEHLDVSVQEAVASGLDHVLVRYFASGEIASRTGSRYWNDLFFVAPCSDGWVLVSVYHWDTLVAWMDSEGCADDLRHPHYSDAEYRRTHSEHVIAAVSRWTQTHTRADLVQTAQLMGLPWAPVAALHDVLKSPQLQARSFFVPIPSRNDSFQQPSTPLLFLSNSPQSGNRRGVPSAGEHNLQVYRDELGLSELEIGGLSSTGVI
jgi:crotonobetainyl-CoA:carnitine CoA-transferase CaiB-like acyl-CoA transferase